VSDTAKDEQLKWYPDIWSPAAQKFDHDLTQTLSQTGKAAKTEARANSSILDRLQSIPCGAGQTSKVVRFTDRPIVAIEVEGVRIPFYISSGENRKTDVEAGKWHPFFGIGENNWFNKTDRMGDYYGSSKLREVAHQLDKKTHVILKMAVDISDRESAPFDFLNEHVPGLDSRFSMEATQAIRHLVDSIEAGTPPKVSGDDIRASAETYLRQNQPSTD
jgi:hypothetical protein